MKFVERISVGVAGVASLGFLVFLVCYLVYDLNYVFRGKAGEAKIVSTTRDFAGFSEDEVDGTQPQYTQRYVYSFDVDGVSYTGEASTFDGLPQVDQVIPVQFMPAAPESHRLLTSGTQFFRTFLYLSIGAFIIACSIPGFRTWLIEDAESERNKSDG